MPPASYDPLSQDEERGQSDDSPIAGEARGRGHNNGILPRPAIYYEDGPFDPPSSEDESEELLEKPAPRSPGDAERGRTVEEEVAAAGLFLGKRQAWSSVRWLVTALGVLVAFSAIVGLFAGMSYRETKHTVRGNEQITMDHIFNGTFHVERQGVNWVPEAGDGVFSVMQDGFITLVDLKKNETSRLVELRQLQDERGTSLTFSTWKLSPDMKYMLVKADPLKQWRWSSFGNYYVHDFETNSTYPLTAPSFPPVTAYATWSPTGESIAYVANNDLYVLPSPAPSTSAIRVTSTGNASLFHGVPDWVYEEEVFSADYALWWAPDSTKLAFLSFDETLVDEFTFPIYNPSDDADAVVPYTEQVTMKYPKPGYNNPLVAVRVFDVEQYLAADAALPADALTLELDWPGRQASNNSIITEIAWVGNDSLLVKENNRNADAGSVVYFHLDDTQALGKSTGAVVRTLGAHGEEGDDGWIEVGQTVHALPAGYSGYLDIVPTKEGFNHIALFSPVNASTPVFLTSGEWEVTGGIAAVDAERGLVYFQAANPSSIERHIYSVSLSADLSTKKVDAPNALTDTSTTSWYSASFSPQGGYYLLNYEGPHVPWQRVVQAHGGDLNYVLTDNAQLNETWNRFEAPIIQYSTISNDGYEFNAVEIRPPNMDDSGRTKYPVLFRVYGGPGSQLVDTRFNRDWHHYVACALQYVVVVVDGRGTGFKGRALRNPVKNNLGWWETRDQIAAARLWAGKEYVDGTRIGIWGWSYGGFMSAKVVEADAGVHSLAMSVAPVTSWRLYDSIYTERYMNVPALNPGGYVNASVTNVTAFGRADYLLAHGSGDDNVHYANSAHLLDMFTAAGIRNFRFRMFTDSDHSINKRGAYRELFEFLTAFLVEKWGTGGKRRGW